MMARIEQHLQQDPNDGQGWQVIAPVYLQLGRASDAVTAYTNALRILGSNSDLEGGLGEAIVTANNGQVTPDAKAAFERAAALAPTDPTARFYLAVALEQSGKTADAIAAWKALLNGAPADAQWAIIGQAELARLQGQTTSAPQAAGTAVASAPNPGGSGTFPSLPAAPATPQSATAAPPAASPAPAAAPGQATPSAPSAADVAAVQNLPPDQQAAMIQGMVDSLATRLETDSGDAAGWAQLVRSYVVLGRPDDARAALVRARAALASDKDKTAIVEEAAESAGLNP